MAFTAACYTRGCGWKRENAKDGVEAHLWGQWHAVEMKLKTGQGHVTNFFDNPTREEAAETAEAAKK